MDKKEALYWEDVPSYSEGASSTDGSSPDTVGVFTQRARIPGGWLYRTFIAERQISHFDTSAEDPVYSYVPFAVSITFVPG